MTNDDAESEGAPDSGSPELNEELVLRVVGKRLLVGLTYGPRDHGEGVMKRVWTIIGVSDVPSGPATHSFWSPDLLFDNVCQSPLEQQFGLTPPD